jgi:pimeloyl-ACP methyl ester carboxylesterase
VLPRRACLGAELPADEDAFGEDGVLLSAVAAGSMAESAGLRGGDQIRSIAGMRVTDLCTLSAALRKAGEAPEVEICFVRDGQPQTGTASVVVQPLEPLEGVTYGELAIDNTRLRTIVTRVTNPRALVVVLQGIACESIDHALTPDAPLAQLVAGWAAAGLDSFRFDKRGVGDSEGGPCHEIGFRTELEDARHALACARQLARERRAPLFVFGHSVGGIMAALLAREVAGVIVYGTPVMRWLACLQDSVGRQLRLRGEPADEIERQVHRLDELAGTGELNGRSAQYHRELDVVDSEVAWRGVDAPTLVLRGEHDWVVRDDDQARIGELCSGPTTIVDLPDLDHLFGKHVDRAASLRDYGAGTFDRAIIECTVDWVTRTLRAQIENNN